MKKFIKVSILGVIATAILALAAPTPLANACVLCLYKPCPACTVRYGQTCFRCATCVALPGCIPN